MSAQILTTAGAEPSATLDPKLSTKINLAGMDLGMLQRFFCDLGEKKYHALQVFKWIHQRGVLDFAAMSDLGKALRLKLADLAEITFPKIVKTQVARDGTHKWLVQVSCGKTIETVFIPEKTRGTLCISSQVGCAVNCSFCLTARQGFQGNLSVSDIIGQVWLAMQQLQTINHPGVLYPKITNVVMMGMGEPLLNFDAVVTATNIMRDDNAYNLARRRVTVSTAGIVPGIEKLAVAADVALAVSLHAPNDELRTQLVPINRKYPIADLIKACKYYLSASKSESITIEYVMLAGINDTIIHAKQLVKLLSTFACKVNLIPHNSFAGSQYVRSADQDLLLFQNILKQAGIVTTIRTTRGDDISAACGMLAGELQPRSKPVMQLENACNTEIACKVMAVAKG